MQFSSIGKLALLYLLKSCFLNYLCFWNKKLCPGVNVLFIFYFSVSDSCYNGLNEDRSGPALAQEVLSLKNLVIFKDIVPDSESRIRKTLKEWSHISKGCNVILTTGGTGFSSRDVTPEATKSVIDKEAPALVVAMTVESLKITDLAVLSRSVCGIKNKTLIINLPGSAKAATECFRIIRNAIPHAVAVLTGQNENVAKTHREIHSHSISCGQSKVSYSAFGKIGKNNLQSTTTVLLNV